MKRTATAPLVILGLTACNNSQEPAPELALAALIADACPIAAPNDSSARLACADNLTGMEQLRDLLVEPLLWGGQPKDMPLERVVDDAHLTEFNPRVWRRMYLSTFMFSGAPRVETAGPYRVLRMPVQFRNMLESGEYPYPFWHSENKWRSYETALDLLFFFKDGKIIAAVRSEDADASRAHNERMWDGAWTWEDGEEPRATLFPFLFSAGNPHITRLESTYRDFSDGMRRQSCMTCHSPDNSSKMHHLELLNYPNQALAGRHDVIRILEENAMPPGTGVADQVVRFDLIRLATEFAAAGDDALAFEGEPVPAHP